LPTVRAIWTLLAATALAKIANTASAIARQAWRTDHTITAMINHYRRRGDLLPVALAMHDRRRRSTGRRTEVAM
jgi:hypothetical protein